MKVRKEVVVTFAWATWPERTKGAKDEVKRPEGPPTRLLVLAYFLVNFHIMAYSSPQIFTAPPQRLI